MLPPSAQIPLRKDEKQDVAVENVHLLDDFCRKRPEPGEINHAALIKRVKTVENSHIATVGGQDSGKT